MIPELTRAISVEGRALLTRFSLLKLKSGSSLPLQVGMSLTANIKLRKVSYLQLLMGGLRDRTESLREF